MRLTALLPPVVRTSLEDHPSLPSLVEVVMDLGRPSMARFPEGDVVLSGGAEISEADLDHATQQVGEFDGDNRAGIDATLHRISCIRNRQGRIVGLTCRVGRAIPGTADLIEDLARAGSSILLLGPPGVGKTTAIRDIARMLAGDCQRRVVVVDTSNEIGGDGDVPHPAIGGARRMQVAHPQEQHRVMIEAVENHMPEVIIIDEISTEAECLACRTIAQRGVQLIATAHGAVLENVLKNPALSELVGGIQSVTLGDDSAKKRGTQKSVLERAGPPCFEAAVEMLQRGSWKVHLDVAAAVDAILSGAEARGQLRERDEAGRVVAVQYVQRTTVSSPGEMFGVGSWASPSIGPGSAWGLQRGGSPGVTTIHRLGSTVLSPGSPAPSSPPPTSPPPPTPPASATSRTSAAPPPAPNPPATPPPPPAPSAPAAAPSHTRSPSQQPPLAPPAGAAAAASSPGRQRQQQQQQQQQALLQGLALQYGAAGRPPAPPVPDEAEVLARVLSSRCATTSSGSGSSGSSSSSGGSTSGRGSSGSAASGSEGKPPVGAGQQVDEGLGVQGAGEDAEVDEVAVYLLMDRAKEERVWGYIQAADPQGRITRAETLEGADLLVASLHGLRANSKVRNTAKKLHLPTITLSATSASSLARRLAPQLGLDPFLAVGGPDGWVGGSSLEDEESGSGSDDDEDAADQEGPSPAVDDLPGDEWADLMAAAVEDGGAACIGREYAALLLQRFVDELPHCSTGALVTMVAGLGRAKGRRRLVAANREKLDILTLECSSRFDELTGSDLARVVEGLAALGFVPSASNWLSDVEKHAAQRQGAGELDAAQAALLAGHLQQLKEVQAEEAVQTLGT